jgi:hypothetical protein
LQILPSQPPIKLVALASAMKLILEWQWLLKSHITKECAWLWQHLGNNLCASLFLLLFLYWSSQNGFYIILARQWFFRFVFIYLVHYAVHYRKKERYLLQLSWHHH